MNNPELFLSDGWRDYELLDAGGGRRLERWGKVILSRPDPQALWPVLNQRDWAKADAIYHRSAEGGGEWEFKKKLPEHWSIRYGDLAFKVRPTGFKHTGLFPEQAANWDFIFNTIAAASGRKVKMLNLFGYTGGASVAAAAAGAEVCHVDSSRGMLSWCKENAQLSEVNDNLIRLIPEDCLKFAERELKRGNRYDAIVMDPPSFGRGAKGEVWKLEEHLMRLIDVCSQLLTQHPLFFIINSYTAGISPMTAANMFLSMKMPFSAVNYGELALPFDGGKRFLPCGICVRGDNTGGYK